MNTKKILITGGRAPATLFLIRKLAQENCNIFCAESFDFHISKFSNCIKKNIKIASPKNDLDNFKNDILEIIKKEKIDILIPTCEEIFYIAKIKPELEKYCKVFCDDFNKLIKLHNKWSFVNKKFKNIYLPKSWLIKNELDLKNILNNENIEKYILKPVFSRFATKVEIIFKNSNINKIDLKNQDYILQEFIEGEQYCSYSIINNNKIALYSDYKTKYSADLGATIAFEFENNDKIYNFVENFAKDNDFEGQIAFDFIQTKDNLLYLIECNPRLTSGVQLFNNNENILNVFIENDFNNTIFPKKQANSVLAFAMLIYGIKKIKSMKTLKKWFKTTFLTKDVIFDRKDIKPFLFQGFILLFLLLKSFQNKIPLKEISTYDIEWNGENYE